MNIKRKLNQFAVYWAPAGLDANLATTYGSPVQLRCRWEDVVQLMMDAKGDSYMTKAVIDLEVPVVALGVLWKGKKVNIASGTDPMVNAGASAIRSTGSIPNRKASQTLYTAYL